MRIKWPNVHYMLGLWEVLSKCYFWARCAVSSVTRCLPTYTWGSGFHPQRSHPTHKCYFYCWRPIFKAFPFHFVVLFLVSSFLSISGTNQIHTLTQRGNTTGNQTEDETKILVLQRILWSKFIIKCPESVNLSQLSLPEKMGATF
jgi:hypothetical protein